MGVVPRWGDLTTMFMDLISFNHYRNALTGQDGHKNPALLNDIVQKAGEGVLGDVSYKFNSVAGLENMPLSELQSAILHADEKDTGVFLDFQSIMQEMAMPQGDFGPRSTFKGAPGRLVLTSRRLLVISTSNFVWGRFEPRVREATKPGSYALSATKGHTMFFYPLSLDRVLHVTMDIEQTVKSDEILIYHNQRCCVWLFGGCYSCLYPKEWYSRASGFNPVSDSRRTIELYIELPPWNQRVKLLVEVAPSYPLTLMRDFIKRLQELAPVLRGNGFEGEGVAKKL